MCIKFNISAINTMGKNASGVTAISLKDDDNVIFGDIIYEDAGRELDEKEKYLCVDKLKTNLILNSLNGETKIIPISDISTQNRAGRGKKI